MLNGFRVQKNSPAKFSGAANIQLVVTIFPAPVEGDVYVADLYLQSRGWNIYRTNFDAHDYLTWFVIGSTSDNLNTVANVFKRDLINAGLSGIQSVSAIFLSGVTPTPTPTPTPTVPPGGRGGGIEKYLKELGETIGFDAKSALVGGALVAVIVAAILLKK